MDPDIHVRIPTEPMAATASLPSRPTHAISVRLYAICINDVAMIGIARLNNWRLIGPCVRFFIPCISFYNQNELQRYGKLLSSHI